MADGEVCADDQKDYHSFTHRGCTLHCLTSHKHAPKGLIESLSDQVVLANRLNWLGAKGKVIVRCINSTNHPLELAAGLTIETFTSIDQQDITQDRGRQSGSERCTLTMPEV